MVKRSVMMTKKVTRMWRVGDDFTINTKDHRLDMQEVNISTASFIVSAVVGYPNPWEVEDVQGRKCDSQNLCQLGEKVCN